MNYMGDDRRAKRHLQKFLEFYRAVEKTWPDGQIVQVTVGQQDSAREDYVVKIRVKLPEGKYFVGDEVEECKKIATIPKAVREGIAEDAEEIKNMPRYGVIKEVTEEDVKRHIDAAMRVYFSETEAVIYKWLMDHDFVRAQEKHALVVWTKR